MSQRLSLDDVRHVAKLARLELSDEELDTYAAQLSSVLEHVERLGNLDLEGVSPMAHPLDLVNRLDEDRVEPSLPAEVVFSMAPATEGAFLAVPKVLPGGGP